MDRKLELKKNVSVFEQDVGHNDGYLYTTNAKFSSVVANKRQSEAIHWGIRFFLKRAKVSSLVDIGSGDGTYTAEIKKAFSEIQVTGFDPASKAVEIATKRYSNVEFAVGNALDPATLPQRSFDLAIYRGVLHHVQSPEIAIQNTAPIAKNLIILEPNGWNPILKLIEKLSPYHREHEERSFAPTKLERWCRDAGYRVLDRRFVGYVPFFCPTPFAKVVYFFQPFLEKIPGLRDIFAGCSLILCERI